VRSVVHSIQISRGGVPKQPVAICRVGAGGIEGDVQRDRRYHGGPDRAVCLYSWERIEALRAEGHPIAPGAIGENLTIGGLDWEGVTPGVRLEIGEVILEVTAYASPCRKIAGALRHGAFIRVSQKVHPGWSRVYSRVVVEGWIEPGLAVTLVPAPAPFRGWDVHT
jgi:MOSC domain-containing protein YiiM